MDDHFERMLEPSRYVHMCASFSRFCCRLSRVLFVFSFVTNPSPYLPLDHAPLLPFSHDASQFSSSSLISSSHISTSLPSYQLKDKGAAQLFQPSKTFQGPRPGMAFKRGPRGVGYYEDAYEMKKVRRWLGREEVNKKGEGMRFM